ncbi:MAG TPA: choice-of-anchor tandem repeat GloVer-containing protein [Candidatus Limnocylindrales bacterium]|nr:choice-of-anchor tandem repeat GloVer-containing protein [Candidatus Limnocylindrales bacterium]
MKRNSFLSSAVKLVCLPLNFGIGLSSGFLLLATVLPGVAAGRQIVPYKLFAAMTNSTLVAPSVGWKRLNLAIGLPLRNQEVLNQLLKEINDPGSTNYHHYLTPEQFTERFGPTKADYEAVVRFAQSHGLTVTGRHPNRVLLDVKGMAANIERAFHVKLGVYQHPTEARTFYAPNAEPWIDLDVPVLSISGLDNFQLPRPMIQKKTPVNEANGVVSQTGSGPSGTYMGYDFRAAYLPGVTQTGTGQSVGLLEFDSGFYTSDILRYESLTGLPNVPVQAVLLDGYDGGPGGGNDEVSLDIEMAISIAPGLSNVLVYEGSFTDDILNRMATDNLAKQIGASWTYSIDATSDQIFKEFAAQGQSFFNASGDSDAYPGTIPTPSDDTNIICVGGTTLTTSGPGGAWVSETVWNWGGGTGSSGGISTVNAIPSWQMGINMTANQGSTTMRNIPDVAMVADNIWVAYGNGQSGDFGGTSCATPLWAGFTALVNQLALANGEPLAGFLNPDIYAIGKGSNSASYATLFHDITTGNNESSRSPTKFSAVPGYDLCTGWGTPAGSNLLTALALPEPLRITSASGTIISGPVGGPFNPTTVNYVLTDHGAGSLNWTLVNTSSWLNVFPTNGTLVSGGPAATVTASINATASSLMAGGYTAALRFTNLNDGFGQTRLITLAVVTPPVITAQPTNQAVLVGMSAGFSVGTGTNALLFYQWQDNRTNLTDGGNISGSATSTLAVSNVTYANAGSYSVIVSNAAGVAVSSNALLTIVPSPPVIVQQPTNQTVLPGAAATFNVAAIGDTPYFYHWQFNGTNLANGANVSGVTTSSLVISSVYSANVGVYSVIVSNSLGWTTSTGAVLSAISVTALGVALQPLWSFTGGQDGAFLYSPLTPLTVGNYLYLYGTAIEGGANGWGTIFRANTNGALSGLSSFNYSNGGIPYAGLVLGKNSIYLYGTTYLGGAYGDGTIFVTTPAGSSFTLVSFNGQNGMLPVAGLTQGVDGNFYGTTLEGGAYGYGTVFKMTTAGALTTLVSFNSTDGAYPSCVLVQGADGNFYGTTELGGASGVGTIFKVSPSGAFTLLHSFTYGNDGAEPIPGLTQGVDGNFYGNTITGGSGGYGTVFRLTPVGVLTTLYSFTNGSDGGNPWGGLMQASDGNLYGTTQGGGTYGYGTVFRIAPNGPLVPLVQFDGYEGANPSAAMVQTADGSLYGTTLQGGSDGDGAIFKLSISGTLQITGQPADQSTYLGGTALFTVATFGSSPVFYQWQRDGTNLTDGGNISGANTATLCITNVTVDDVALYSVVVSNSVNSVSSDYAVLEVIFSPPDITSQPASLIRLVGMTASFSVTASGDPPLSYQWQENGTNLTDGGNISGSTTSTLTLTSVTSADNGTYSVIVSNPLYAVSSVPATLTVVPATAPSASVALLRQFTGGSDGAFPYAGLIQGKDGNLYGATVEGGSKFDGTIFRWSLANGLTTLYSFTGGNDGANPYGRLVQSTNGNYYGTTFQAGANGYGTIFRMTANGSVTPLSSFTGGTDGGDPYAGLIQGDDGNYYGTAFEGGANFYGSVFKLTANGALTGLYEFTDGDDGAYPYAGLIQGTDENFYGTTLYGGAFGYGTVFSLNTDGKLKTLVSFDYAKGGYPEAGVIQGADGNFYGTTSEGGTNGYGTVFRLNTNGSLTTLFSFGLTNGANPIGALVQGNDGNLYGTTSSGGAGGQGSVFKITTNGVLTTLIWFDGLNGANPQGALIQASNGCFYGTTPFGGLGFNSSAGGGNGTIFQVTVPVFITNSFAAAPAIGNLPYSATIAGAAIAPAGDPLSFAKASGPAWLVVTANGVLSGTPANSDLGTNLFVVSLNDSNGVSASATLEIVVNQDPPPSFVVSPFTEPWANVNEEYSGTIATNAYDLELPNGDVLTFAKVSGPAWLSVAADGTLSGTPQGTDGGTNTFVVSVVNLGGLSNTATMFLYVNSPPYFTSPNFTKPAATVGLPYSGNIATNATDPDLGAGDVFTFYKVTGPAWLDVAADGALSGTPSSSNVGTGNYLMLVVDSGGLAGIGTLNLTVNTDRPPVFASNPFTESHANAGQAYSGTMATNVSDPNFGDPITLSKVSGPVWLNVAPNGLLSGTPAASDAGTNSFVVNATDLEGVSSQATMFITVAGPIHLEILQGGGQVVLSWSGGCPPYQVQTGTNLVNTAWGNFGAAINSTNLILTPSNSAAYFRVQGQ